MIDQSFIERPQVQVVACRIANGKVQYRLYDPAIDELSVSSLSVPEAQRLADGRPIPEMNLDDLRERRDAEYERRRDDSRRKREQEWNEEQARRLAYYQTPQWQARRAMVLTRDDYVCQARIDGCTIQATQAHHRTYERLYHEPLFDLEAVCRHCHEALHASERQKWMRNLT